MDKYLIPLTSCSSQCSKPLLRRPQWKRSVIQLNGKIDSNYRHDIYNLSIHSYSQVGAFPHRYNIDDAACPTHENWILDGYHPSRSISTRSQGVSALEFDSKGIYLASVTRSGCLTVHDFDDLHSLGNSRNSIGLKEDEKKQVLHISTCQPLDVVRWNLMNQYEVACTSRKSSEVKIFDLGYISSEPIEILRKRPTISVHGCNIETGFSDISFSSNDNSRVYASDMIGVINIWDRRTSGFPCFELRTNCSSAINSIKMNADNEVMYGATKHGTIYMWDLRGGSSSSAFQNNRMANYAPMAFVKLASELEKIDSLKAQSNIVSKEILSIDLNPSCPYQLAFHLDDGWSGVFDIHNLRVTHVHCPPPPWLDDFNDLAHISYLRKPSWLPMYSIAEYRHGIRVLFSNILGESLAFRTEMPLQSRRLKEPAFVYAVGSLSSTELLLLDFYPDRRSPCHVEYNEDVQCKYGINGQHKQNVSVPLSEGVTACAVHPLYGAIVAGTQQSSLLLISQTSTLHPETHEALD